jgi:hypothetical protein
MRCSKCGADNRESAKFCDGCGAQLLTQCPSCGIVARVGARFCYSCGAALRDAAPTGAVDTARLAASAVGERRHLTVLFCDPVGSTEIAAQLDPEEWRELVADYHRAVAEAVTRYGGHVAKYLDDGVMAYFGWPEAHENDAERATRAGLAVLEEVSKFNQQSTHPKSVGEGRNRFCGHSGRIEAVLPTDWALSAPHLSPSSPSSARYPRAAASCAHSLPTRYNLHDDRAATRSIVRGRDGSLGPCGLGPQALGCAFRFVRRRRRRHRSDF